MNPLMGTSERKRLTGFRLLLESQISAPAGFKNLQVDSADELEIDSDIYNYLLYRRCKNGT